MSSSIAELLKKSTELNTVSDSARLDIEVLLAYVLKKDRSFLYTWPEKALTLSQLDQFNVCFERRKQGVPIAHIVEQKEFWSLTFKTNPSTLIPRPETEILVEFCIEQIKLHLPLSKKNRVLDLGTGTGAIAIAIAKTFPEIRVDGVDKIQEAIKLAKSNATLNAVHNAKFFLSDWFSNVDDSYDVIVSNPPYVAPEDPHLEQGDVSFEPKSALVAREKGLADIYTIIQKSKTFLKSKGFLCIEHGWNQGDEVRTALKQYGFNQIETKRDYSRNERVTGGWKKMAD